MDLSLAEHQLNTFLDRRAAKVKEDRPGQQAANELQRIWAESDRRFQVRRRLQLNAEWYAYHLRLCEVFRERAAVHEAKAHKFLEDQPRGETA